MAILFHIAGAALLVLAYLWRCNRAISITHPEAEKLCQKAWTKEQVQEAYRKAQTSPIDVRPFLLEQQHRRYVVTGGSGLSGGWIVQHLIMRGEHPKAIRIIDLVPNKRPEVVEAGIAFHKTDVSDPKSVEAAFEAFWPDEVAPLPLTVLHTVAMINPADRKKEFAGPLIKVNIEGTRNVLEAAHKAGASCFVATSSGSVGAGLPDYFPPPWQRFGKDIYQFRENADPPISLDAPLEKFPICYTWSKAQAEKLVREASSDKCPTGIIRPTNGVYGTNVENPSSLTWDYLRRGGSPSWLYEVVQPFVCAQNVSIAHLALEKALLERKPGVAGSAYCVTDPNPPVRFKDLYLAMSSLAHPLTPVTFPNVPFVLMYLLALLVEQYKLVRHHYFPSLPFLSGDLAYMQPGVFKVCTTHMVFTDTRAREEIDYRGAFSTLDGVVDCVLDWNRKVEARSQEKVESGQGSGVHVQEGSKIPKPPAGS